MDDATPRADRRTAQRARARRRRLVVAVAVGLLVVVGAVVAVLALSGGGGDHRAASPTTTSRATTVALQLGDVTSASAGPAATFTAAQASDVLKVIGTYIDRAIVAPMHTGGEAGDLASLFDAGTLARVSGPDKAVMTETGLPKASGSLKFRAQPVPFVALGDQSGAVVLVSASIDLTVDAKVVGSKTPLHVEQKGDLVLAPDAGGAWKVTSYSMSVTRNGGGVGATSTSAPATTKGSR
jgi:hypothetical protein